MKYEGQFGFTATPELYADCHWHMTAEGPDVDDIHVYSEGDNRQEYDLWDLLSDEIADEIADEAGAMAIRLWEGREL